MKLEEVADAIDGFMAYEAGCTDSGIRDEVLKNKVSKYLKSLSENEFRILVSRISRDMLSENRLKMGYGMKDAVNFWEYVNEMGR